MKYELLESAVFARDLAEEDVVEQQLGHHGGTITSISRP
jgi:hypothetical protein